MCVMITMIFFLFPNLMIFLFILFLWHHVYFSPSNHKNCWTADAGPARLIKTQHEVESSPISEEYFSASLPS